jgi:hypothetical protein
MQAPRLRNRCRLNRLKLMTWIVVPDCTSPPGADVTGCLSTD